MDETSPPPTVVCDAGPVIHLDEVNRLWLLGTFPGVLIPEAVCAEIRRHAPGALDRLPSSCRIQPWDPPMDPEVGALAPMFSLGAGEVAALTLSRRRPSLIFLTDDMAARLAAVQLGVRAHGTLGVLLRSVRRGDIPKQEMMALLRSLPGRSSLYLRNDLLEEVVRELDGWRPDDGQ